MNAEAEAIRLALDLMHVPSRLKLIRDQPLPVGVGILLRIAAGEEDACEQAVGLTGRSRSDVCRAAAFFIEQMMFMPDASSYRVLGARPDASTIELRRNMALLLRWLHPDTNSEQSALYPGRVTRAWDDLKTPERRRAYDQACQRTQQRQHKGSSLRRLRHASRLSILKPEDQDRRDAQDAGELRAALRSLFPGDED